jgi:hypothetical protein
LPSRDIALAQCRKDKSSQRKAVRMQARSPKQGLSAWQAWLHLQAGYELESLGSFYLLYVWQLLSSSPPSERWRAKLKNNSRHQWGASLRSPKSQRRTPFGNFENRPSPSAAATEDAAQSNR